MGEVLTEVPEILKRLVRCILRGFYAHDHSLIMDVLVRNPCIKEESLMELLHFERKQLRAAINTLKNDKFIKIRMKVETDEEGRNTRHNYYFINYKIFVNVVKYKLDHMRRKIETEERDNTSRASFRCPGCEKTFTDLETDRLFDFLTGALQCTYCQTEVEEDESAVPKKDARTLLARFNEQIQPIYDMLRDCDDIRLAPSLLEPEPMDIKINKGTHGQKTAADQKGWSGAASKSATFGYTESTVTVTVNETDLSPTKEAVKETPIWLAQSTVDGVPMTDNNVVAGSMNTSKASGSKAGFEDIMRTLLAHEKKGGGHKVRIPGTGSDDSSTSESEDEKPKSSSSHNLAEMESDDEDEPVPLVTIGNQHVLLSDVTEEMVSRMTAPEKEEYIRLGQEMYASMYE